MTSEEILRKNREWRRKNADKVRLLRKSWPSQSAEIKAAQFKKYYDSKSEHRKASSRKYYEANKAAVRARQNAHREANREEVSARAKARYDANPEPWKARARNRSARKRTVRIGRVDYKSIRSAFNGVCGLCNQSLDLATDKYHYDHIIPLAAGGSHETRNLQIAHARCNLKKGARAA